jgi:replicative DNA helicase
MAIENQVEALFIDYLQLINWDLEMPDSPKSDPEHVITELKRFAHEYNIALIVTSGLTRGVDLRSGDKRPMLSDLSDMTRSDMIEELADNILLLHRPAYYGIIEDEHGNDLMNRTEVIIARSKDGFTGNIYFRNDFQSLINVSST